MRYLETSKGKGAGHLESVPIQNKLAISHTAKAKLVGECRKLEQEIDSSVQWGSTEFITVGVIVELI